MPRFQSSGHFNDSVAVLNILLRDGTSSFDNSFNMRGDILSCPDTFLGFNSFSAFCTSAGCIVLKLNGLIPVIVDTADLIA